MAEIILFHSILGLREAEQDAAERLRAAGHSVVTPDLFAGHTATTVAEGFALKDQTFGWTAIEQRARNATHDIPSTAVLAGVSMGAGVVQSLLPTRPYAAGLLLLHGLADIARAARRGIPVQPHISADDPFFPPEAVTAWRQRATAAGADVEVFAYPDTGHYFTDPRLADYAPTAATRTWERALAFLDSLPSDAES